MIYVNARFIEPLNSQSLIQFTNCTVTYKNEVLFSPEMGDFDMAVGKEIVSAFTGAADYNSFPIIQKPSHTKTIASKSSEKENQLNSLYAEVRNTRNNYSDSNTKELLQIFETLKNNYPSDWLLPLEIYELTKDNTFLNYLNDLKNNRPKVAHLIEAGLSLI